MNSFSKLIASLSALIASVALLWAASSIEKYVAGVSGTHVINIIHRGEITLDENRY